MSMRVGRVDQDPDGRIASHSASINSPTTGLTSDEEASRGLEAALPGLRTLARARDELRQIGQEATRSLTQALFQAFDQKARSRGKDTWWVVDHWRPFHFLRPGSGRKADVNDEPWQRGVVSAALTLRSLRSPRWMAAARKAATDAGREGLQALEKELLNRIRERLELDRECCSKDLTVGWDRNRLFAPALQIARAMRGIQRSRQGLLDSNHLYCFFATVQELYRISEGHGNMGSARSRASVFPSAFVTSECVRAIRGLGELFDETTLVVRHLRELLVDTVHLQLLAKDCPEWVEAESKRVLMTKGTTLQSIGARSLLWKNVPTSDALESLDAVWPLLEKALKELAALTQEAATSAKSFKNQAETIIKAERAVKNASRGNEERRDQHDPFGIGADQSKSVLADFSTRLHKLNRLLAGAVTSLGTCNAHRSAKNPDRTKIQRSVAGFSKNMVAVENELQGLGTAMRRTTKPSAPYFRSVVERELTASSIDRRGSCSYSELAFAAAGLVSTSKEVGQSLIKRVSEILNDGLSNDGTFDRTDLVDMLPSGYELRPPHFEALRAFAQILEHLEEPISEDLVRRIAAGFLEHTRYDDDKGAVFGWGTHAEAGTSTAVIWPTSSALVALESVLEMLDKRINRRVSVHFNSRNLRGRTPRLNSLFYGDMGHLQLCMDSPIERDLPQEGPSLAEALQLMRRHVLDLDPASDSDCQSSVLFGPPGTGKTTLFEALAASCQALLIEVTPSDIVVAGEAAIERRARHVFEALQYLSNCVVLFDEFESVVRNRALKESGGLSTFSFLTPGMLPKLKALRDQANKNNFTFGLITNQIGFIDKAAIRGGRFDWRAGVFSADPLSRLGRLVDQVRRPDPHRNSSEVTAFFGDRTGDLFIRDEAVRLAIAVLITAGKPASMLGPKVGFAKPKPSKKGKRDLLNYLVEKKAPLPDLDSAQANDILDQDWPDYEVPIEDWSKMNSKEARDPSAGSDRGSSDPEVSKLITWDKVQPYLRVELEHFKFIQKWELGLRDALIPRVKVDPKELIERKTELQTDEETERSKLERERRKELISQLPKVSGPVVSQVRSVLNAERLRLEEELGEPQSLLAALSSIVESTGFAALGGSSRDDDQEVLVPTPSSRSKASHARGTKSTSKRDKNASRSAKKLGRRGHTK